jgi:signal transduction histidine kinase
MLDYLDALARTIRGDGAVPLAAAGAWRAVSEQHELAGEGLGSVAGQIEQLLALRRALVAVTREGEPRLEEAEVDLLSTLVDPALLQVVSAYARQRDQQARRLRADHIGFVTHELRNPLTTAMVSASHLPEGEDPESRRAVELVQRNLKRVATLIDTFLLTEQMEADRIHPHREEVLLGELLDASLAPALAATGRPEVRLSVAVDRGLAVKVDTRLTAAALESVITSAVQFSDGAMVSIDAEVAGERVIIHVRDHCRGVPADRAPLILEPFQSSHPGKPVPGLGLALARRVMEAQGGRIEVDTGSADGCDFRITLPRGARGPLWAGGKGTLEPHPDRG